LAGYWRNIGGRGLFRLQLLAVPKARTENFCFGMCFQRILSQFLPDSEAHQDLHGRFHNVSQALGEFSIQDQVQEVGAQVFVTAILQRGAGLPRSTSCFLFFFLVVLF
jgi:hypothetical protein